MRSAQRDVFKTPLRASPFLSALQCENPAFSTPSQKGCRKSGKTLDVGRSRIASLEPVLHFRVGNGDPNASAGDGGNGALRVERAARPLADAARVGHICRAAAASARDSSFGFAARNASGEPPAATGGLPVPPEARAFLHPRLCLLPKCTTGSKRGRGTSNAQRPKKLRFRLSVHSLRPLFPRRLSAEPAKQGCRVR